MSSSASTATSALSSDFTLEVSDIFNFSLNSNVMSGKRFKEAHPDKLFYRITNELELHRGFQYQTGVNIDHLPFDSTGECIGGGLYFTELNKMAIWIESPSSVYIRQVEIMDDSFVHIQRNKFKADKFILRERVLIEDFELWNDPEFCLHTVTLNGWLLKYVKTQTPETCLAAVMANGYALQHVKEQTEEICLESVKSYPFTLKFVNKQTEEMCLTAVKQSPYTFKYVHNKTEAICLEAVKQNGFILSQINEIDQTRDICLAAVQRNGAALQYVKCQTIEIVTAALKQNRTIAVQFIHPDIITAINQSMF